MRSPALLGRQASVKQQSPPGNGLPFAAGGLVRDPNKQTARVNMKKLLNIAIGIVVFSLAMILIIHLVLSLLAS